MQRVEERRKRAREQQLRVRCDRAVAVVAVVGSLGI